jgi:hypothetical protein
MILYLRLMLASRCRQQCPSKFTSMFFLKKTTRFLHLIKTEITCRLFLYRGVEREMEARRVAEVEKGRSLFSLLRMRACGEGTCRRGVGLGYRRKDRRTPAGLFWGKWRLSSLGLPLSDLPPPTPEDLDHLGRDRRGQGHPEEYEALVNRVCEGQLRDQT